MWRLRLEESACVDTQLLLSYCLRRVRTSARWFYLPSTGIISRLFIHAGARQTIIAELQTAPPTHMAQMCPTWQPERKQAAQTEPHTWEVCEHHLPPVWFLLAGRCCHITEAVCLICLCWRRTSAWRRRQNRSIFTNWKSVSFSSWGPNASVLIFHFSLIFDETSNWSQKTKYLW